MFIRLGIHAFNADQIARVQIDPSVSWIEVVSVSFDGNFSVAADSPEGRALRWWLTTEEGQFWYRRRVDRDVADLVAAYRSATGDPARASEGREEVAAS